jgi:hypothetical protein
VAIPRNGKSEEHGSQRHARAMWQRQDELDQAKDQLCYGRTYWKLHEVTIGIMPWAPRLAALPVTEKVASPTGRIRLDEFCCPGHRPEYLARKQLELSAIANCLLTFSGRCRALLEGPSAAMRAVRNGQGRTEALDRASPPSWVALEAPACLVARRSLQFRARLAHAQIHCLLGPPRARGRLPILHRAVLERPPADPCDEHRWCV